MEPVVEPVLKNLLKKKMIQLTLVETPFNPNSPLYASYFLYALSKNNNVERAFMVRNILFVAATKAPTKIILDIHICFIVKLFAK
jgi:hypothetical protein